LGPRTRNFAKRLRRRHGEDERGAELLEFAFVVVLLITLLYGIITYGVILAAQATVTQAAADGTRAGIVQGTGSATCSGTGQNGTSVSTAGCAAVGQASTDLGWMNKGGCNEWVGVLSGGTVTKQQVSNTNTSPITCTALTESCPSEATNTCLSLTISYNYASSPLFPELPGLGVITPSTITSTNVLQLSTPSGA
jgi:Flp pilus assembly protein TadG